VVQVVKRLFLGEVLTQQTVGVFVEASFPRVVRMGEKDLDSHYRPEVGMCCKLFAIIDCEGLLVAIGDFGERMECSKNEFRGALVLERICNQELGFALNEGADISLLSSSFDGVAFPIPDTGLLLDYSGPHIDETAIRYDATPILTGEAFAAFLVSLAKVLAEIFTIPNPCIYMLVDRLKGYMHLRSTWVFQFQPPSDLLGGMILTNSAFDLFHESLVASLGTWTGVSSTFAGCFICPMGKVES
jgi:hypothetical protein